MEEEKQQQDIDISQIDVKLTDQPQYTPAYFLNVATEGANHHLLWRRASVTRVSPSANGYPQHHNGGICINFQYSMGVSNDVNVQGYQIFFTSGGKLYTREKLRAGGLDQWREIGIQGQNVNINNVMSWNGEGISNANEFKPNVSGAAKVKDPCDHLPQNMSGAKWGTILWLRENTGEGTQIYTQVTGNNIYTRRLTGNTNWSEWRKISTNEDVMLKPEVNGIYKGNINSLYESGFYQTGIGTTGTLPRGINNIGAISVYRNGRDSAIQLWIHTDTKRIFIRTARSNNQVEWEEVAKLKDIPQTFEHYQQTPQNINSIRQSGYYHTTTTTVGLPPQVNEDEQSKIGILKVLKQDNNTMTFEYTPTSGKYKGHIYNGQFNITRTSNTIDWYKVSGSEGHTKIFDTRDDRERPPQEYQDHSGKIGYGFTMFEWKWATSDYIPDEGRAVVQTFVPASRQIQDGQQDIFQIAYVEKNGHQYFRTVQEDKQHWQTQWTPITRGGKTPTITKEQLRPIFKELVKEMFEDWKNKHKQS